MAKTLLPAVAAIGLSACATTGLPAAQSTFFDNLSTLCGRSFVGRVASPPVEADRDFTGKTIIMQVRDCSAEEIRIPVAVGDDRSRTWVVRRAPNAGGEAVTLSLHHDHRHADGSEDRLSRYGGAAVKTGTAQRQEFPADAFTRDLFDRENIPVSKTNVWAIEVDAGRLFAYELRRPGRFFRLEFDLSRPIPG